MNARRVDTTTLLLMVVTTSSCFALGCGEASAPFCGDAYRERTRELRSATTFAGLATPESELDLPPEVAELRGLVATRDATAVACLLHEEVPIPTLYALSALWSFGDDALFYAEANRLRTHWGTRQIPYLPHFTAAPRRTSVAALISGRQPSFIPAGTTLRTAECSRPTRLVDIVNGWLPLQHTRGAERLDQSRPSCP